MAAVADEEVGAGVEGRRQVEASRRSGTRRGRRRRARRRRRPAGPCSSARRDCDQADDADGPRRRGPRSRRRPAPAADAAGSPAAATAARASSIARLRQVPPRQVRRLEPVGQALRPRPGRRRAAAARASSASPTRPAALRRGAMANATVSRSTVARLDAGPGEQGGDAGPRPRAQPLQPELGDRAVLAEHRREVRHGPDRSRGRRASSASAPRRARREEQLRELEGDAAAGEPTVRVGRVGPVRVDDARARAAARPERGGGR